MKRINLVYNGYINLDLSSDTIWSVSILAIAFIILYFVFDFRKAITITVISIIFGISFYCIILCMFFGNRMVKDALMKQN